jgi:hypothetical protein
MEDDGVNQRSVLRLRMRGHLQPGREDEAIVEVVRAGKVVATIYGSREGIHVTSDSLGPRGEGLRAFFFAVDIPPGMPGMPGIVIPILAAGEVCPWCEGLERVLVGGLVRPCPVCGVGGSP